MTICIIPARSGSKRIKNKNIQKIDNVPLIGITIKIAKKSGLFKRIIVSTDCPKIASIAKKYGAEVPFLRDKKLSNDYASTFSVLKDVIKKLKIIDEYFFCIYPTAIMLKKKYLVEAYLKIKKKNFDGLIAVKKFDSNPHRGFKVKKNKLININTKFYRARSQDLPELYHDTGTFYIFKTIKYLLSDQKLMKKTTYYELDLFSGIDINTAEDLKFAKISYNYFKK